MGTAEDTTSRPSQRNGVWVSRDLRDDRSDARSHVVHPQRGIGRSGSYKVRRSPSRKRSPSPLPYPAARRKRYDRANGHPATLAAGTLRRAGVPTSATEDS